MDIASLLEVEVKEGPPSELRTNGEIEDYKNIPDFSIRDIASVRFRKLHCTACDVHIGSAPGQAHNMHEHPILHVLLCTSCRNFYGDGTFEQGDDATDMFCRWCANGGNLYCCSYCSNTFCYACIKRNFDPLVRKKIERDEKWKCFVCNPADLYSARAACWALLQHVQTVTRILQTDHKMTPEEIESKMNLDESQCCPHKSKRKRADTPTDDEAVDETYTVSKRKRRRILNAKRSKRRLIKLEMTETDGVAAESENPRQANANDAARPDVRLVNSPGHSSDLHHQTSEDVPLAARQTRRRLRSRSSNRKNETEPPKFATHDDDIPPPLLQCDQSMVEGAESLSFPALPPGNRGPSHSITRVGITPVPTAHLLKRPVGGPATRGGRDHRIIRGVNSGTPVYVRKVPHPPPKVSQPGSNAKNSGVQSMPMVSIPSRNHMPQSPNRINVIQPPMQNSGLVRNVAGGLLRQIRPRIVLAKSVAKSNTANKSVNNQPPSVIDLESDEDEAPPVTEPPRERTPSESNDRVPELSTTTYPVRPDDGILTILTPTPKSDGDGSDEEGDENGPQQRPQTSSRSFEAAIRGPTKSIEDVLDTLKNKLKKVLESAMIFSPDKELVVAKAKTRAVNHTIKRTVDELTSLSDNLISAYQAYKRECNKEPVRHTPSVTLKKNEKSNKVITLDMLCTRESDSESNESASDEDSDNSQDIQPVREMRPFRRHANVGVDAKPQTEEKSVQVYDVHLEDYEKSVGYALLLKADYDPKSERDILRPVMVPDENFGKYEEEFISYLQHIEDSRTESNVKEYDDDSAMLSVNELVEADLSIALKTGEKPGAEETSENTVEKETLMKTNDENVEILDEHLEISITTTATHSSSSDSDSDSSSSDSETGTSEVGSPHKKKSKGKPNDEPCKEKDDKKELLEKETTEMLAPETEKSTEENREKNDGTSSECKDPQKRSQATEEETVLAVRALIEDDSSENSNSNAALNSWKPVESDDECTVLD